MRKDSDIADGTDIPKAFFTSPNVVTETSINNNVLRTVVKILDRKISTNHNF